MVIAKNILILIVLFSTTLFSYNFSKIEKGKIEYFFPKDDSTFVQSLSTRIQPELQYFEKIFDHALKNKIKIFFPASEDDYEKLSGGRLPEWSGAVAYTEERIIIIKPQPFLDIKKLLITIKHEIIHIVVGDKYYQKNIPLWIHEGLATYLSSNYTSWQEGLVLANAINANKILELQEINSLMQLNTASANLAYLEAKIAVEYLIKNIKISGLPGFLTELDRTQNADIAFKKYLGYDLIDFEYYWYNYQKEKYKWMVVLNFDNLVWFVFIVVVVIAFILVKMRNYKKKKIWKTEELLEHENKED